MSDKPLSGLRILVVEDNALLAMTVDSILQNAGAEVAGPVGTLSEAEQLAAAEPLSGALLDIKLNSDEIWSVARILIDRGVPFILCSGHFDGESLPNEWSTFPILTKPARARQIVERLAGVICAKS
jgi:DNA-binding response OmpR family regulator